MNLPAAIALHQAGDLEAAEAAYRRILAEAEDPVALGNLGVLLNASGRRTEAGPLLRRALCLEPGRAAHWANLGVALGPTPEALEAFAQAEALEPSVASHPYNLGRALTELGRSAEAEAALRRALARPSASPRAEAEARYNLAMALLRQGKLREGFEAMEARWGLPEFQPEPFPHLPWWEGQALDGPLLLFADQGFGDSLMMARYLPYLQREGLRCVLCVERPLHRVLATAAPGLILVAPGEALPPCAAKVALLSLPLRFATDLAHLPAAVSYLAVPREVPSRRALEEALAARPSGPKVGLVWAGNRAHAQDARRSLDPALLAPLADLPGLQWVSLQLGGEASPPLPGLLPLGPHLREFADTAFALTQLDLLITVDTAPAHLAGALGLPTLLLLPHVADWRWLEGRTDSPWYPTLQLLRQPSPGDWVSTVAQLVENLR